jgi:hypothetical protein
MTPGPDLPVQRRLAILYCIVRQQYGGKRSHEFTGGRWERCTKGGRKENVFIGLAVRDEVKYEPPSSGRSQS